jgi:hypothetical protein
MRPCRDRWDHDLNGRRRWRSQVPCSFHPSAWEVNSPKLDFRFTGFYEVRYPQATLSNSKDTLFGRCAVPHNLDTVPPNIGQMPRTASRRRWAPRGVGSQWCNRLPSIPLQRLGEKEAWCGRFAFIATYLRPPPHY